MLQHGAPVLAPRCYAAELDAPLVLPDAAPGDVLLGATVRARGVRDLPEPPVPLAAPPVGEPVALVHLARREDAGRAVGDLFRA